LLVDGTPGFRVEKSIVERRIRILEKRGVVFQLGRHFGKDLSLSELRSRHDAVFLGFDSRRARPLEVPGSGAKGVVQALAFLLQRTTPVSLENPVVNLEGSRVIVLGLGDTALDCARTARRYGATEVTCVYRRGPEDKTCSRNAFEAATEEGVRFVYHAVPIEVVAGKEGSVCAMRFSPTEPGPRDAAGRRTFTIRSQDVVEIPADIVITALGSVSSPCPHSGDCAELEINEWGGLKVDADLATNLAGVFAGGDLVHGPCHVLQAVRDGRTAAAAIHRFIATRPRAPGACSEPV
jgi:glutamate synthase (NADPH/NADH) small chain